jgi:hypothetical protein
MATNNRLVDIFWSPNPGLFDHKLSLNSLVDGGFAFRSRTVDMMGGPEQEAVFAETEFSTPYDVRAKIQARQFSIIVNIMEDFATGSNDGKGYVYDTLWNRRRNELLKAVYSGPVRVGVVREGVGTVFITARCEGVKEIERGIMEVSFLAADPIYTQYDDGAPTFVDTAPTLPGDPEAADWNVAWEKVTFDTGAPPSSDVDAEYLEMYQPYNGTAPTEPVMTVEVTGLGSVWRYRGEFAITNNSAVAWENHAVCVDLGQVLGAGGALVGKARTDLGDLRIETFGGARKSIYLRRHDNAGGGRDTGNYAKIWFVINQLAPGETKYFRLLYKNDSVSATYEPENSSVKPMFNMYDSTNGIWKYGDFAPVYDQPQSRIAQWVPHLHSRSNITWCAQNHPDFNLGAGVTVINGAIGKAPFNGVGSGYAGMQLSTPMAISQIEYDRRTRTNFKAPFVQRSLRPDGGWQDDFVDGRGTGNRTWSWYNHAVNGSFVRIIDSSLTTENPNGVGWFVGDTIRITLDNGTTVDRTISSITTWNGSYSVFNLSSSVGAGRYIPQGATVYQYPSGLATTGRTQTFASGQEPRTVMMGIRVDRPDLPLGDWFYAGSDYCHVTFKSAEVPSVLWRNNTNGNFDVTTFGSASRKEFDHTLVNNGYQLSGYLVNDNDGTRIKINTILSNHLKDRLVVDCDKKTCLYYKWNSTTLEYDPPENRYEALYFDDIREYWIKMVPEQERTAVRFIHDPDSNFRNLTVTIRWANRYY